jgi:molecular chaperone GrpE
MTPEDDKEIPDAVDPVSPDAPDSDAIDGDPYAELEADVMKWRELAVRTAADLDNFRKRSAREREDAIRYANQGLLEDLLPVIDNFEMGMLAAAQDKSSMIYIGMDMVRRQLNDFLAAQGVTEIPAEGKSFDPNIHEAVSQEAASGVEDGTVLRVHRRGFMLRDRLLRPATVVVAKANEKEG